MAAHAQSHYQWKIQINKYNQMWIKWKEKYRKISTEKTLKAHADAFDRVFVSFLLKIAILCKCQMIMIN